MVYRPSAVLAKFIADLGSVAKPIKELKRKGAKFEWEEEQQTAFEWLKQMITHAGTLHTTKSGAGRELSRMLHRLVLVQYSHNCKRTSGWSSRIRRVACQM